MIMGAQCQATRDVQIQEKRQIQAELLEEEKRLDVMMEVERRKALETEEEIDELRKNQMIRWRELYNTHNIFYGLIWSDEYCHTVRTCWHLCVGGGGSLAFNHLHPSDKIPCFQFNSHCVLCLCYITEESSKFTTRSRIDWKQKYWTMN